jgi:hypothetical protein
MQQSEGAIAQRCVAGLRAYFLKEKTEAAAAGPRVSR